MSALVDAWEETVDEMANRLVEAWNAVSTQIGDRPIFQEQLPERQQCRQYQLVRNDPNAWTALMKEHGYKATVEYMKHGEQLSRKYPDEVVYGQEAMPAQPMPTAVAPAPEAPMMPPQGAPNVAV